MRTYSHIREIIVSSIAISLFIISGCAFSSNLSKQTNTTSDLSTHQIEQILYQANHGTVAGNPKGTVTVVDFFDYFCYPCRIVTKELNTLVQKDKWLRVVYIDFPILEEQSTFAARAALAASYQHKYQAMHHAMMTSTEPLDQSVIFKIASQEGLSLKKLQADINSKKITQKLQNNKRLAKAFGIQDLPTAIIGYTRPPHQAKIYFGSKLLGLEKIVKTLHKS